MSNVLIKQAAVIGGGVVGGGWAARLLLNGVNVRMFDPDLDAERKLQASLDNAEHAWNCLTPEERPVRGTLKFCDSVAEAVEGAELVQESVPERLEIKTEVHAEIGAHIAPTAIIGSSTSGLLPTDIQASMPRADRMMVAHPYVPVYLLPLVELVGGEKTSPAAIEQARLVYAGLGMKPVVIRREIDAFVGDRLLEAVWREALWLLKDDVTTAEELDDIIRYSFGLRWAQMGLFMTYRLGGGEAGMRHFLEQFGPTLTWPWTKLMDVPDLDDALIDKIATQSDEQAGGRSIRELERIRDENLSAIMRALSNADAGKGWGAGEIVHHVEALMRERKRDAKEPD